MEDKAISFVLIKFTKMFFKLIWFLIQAIYSVKHSHSFSEISAPNFATRWQNLLSLCLSTWNRVKIKIILFNFYCKNFACRITVRDGALVNFPINLKIHRVHHYLILGDVLQVHVQVDVVRHQNSRHLGQQIHDEGWLGGWGD